MPSPRDALTRLKTTLTRAAKATRTCADQANVVSQAFKRLASERAATAQAEIQGTRDADKATRNANGIAKAGCSGVLKALGSLTGCKDQSASAVSRTLLEGQELVTNAAETRRRVMDDLHHSVREYCEATEDRREAILENLGQENKAIGEHVDVVTRAKASLIDAEQFVERLSVSRSEQTDRRSQMRAVRINKEGCRQLQEGNWSEAVRLFDLSCELHRDPVLFYNLAVAHYAAGNLAGASEKLGSALGEGLAAAVVVPLRALIAIKTGDEEAARNVAADLGADREGAPFPATLTATCNLTAGATSEALWRILFSGSNFPAAAKEWGCIGQLITDLLSSVPGPRRLKDTNSHECYPPKSLTSPSQSFT